MLMMDDAWKKGIAPSVFRQSNMSDLMFLLDMDNFRSDMKDDKIHEEKIREAMNALQLR